MLQQRDVLNFIADWSKWKSKSAFFHSVAELFGKQTKLAFYGLAKNESKKEYSVQLRFLWGTEFADDILDRLLAQKEMTDVVVIKQQKQFCYLAYLGSNIRQHFFFIVELPQKLETDIQNYLFSYLAGGFSFFIRLTDRNRLLNLAYTDDVTGFFNQRKLTRDLNQLIKDFEQQQTVFSVLFIDIDHFKNVNDNYGHLIGSKLLYLLAQTISATLREDDLLYRYGGDEFVLLLPRITYEQAVLVGQRLINLVKVKQFVFDKKLSFQLSISIGVAQFPIDANTRDSILELADMMMYEAKKQGRGRVCSARDIVQQGHKK